MSAEEFTRFMDALETVTRSVGDARAVVPRDLVTPLLGTGSRAYLDAWDSFTLGEPTSGTS